MHKIYTKTGDHGETSLADGSRLTKDHPIVESYGNIDELNSFIGWIESSLPEHRLILVKIQNDLFSIGSEVAAQKQDIEDWYITPSSTKALEEDLDKRSESLEPLRSFILPGGSEATSLVHVTRTICRRAERSLITASNHGNIRPEIIKYINRLSDWLFVFARFVANEANITESKWQPKR